MTIFRNRFFSFFLNCIFLITSSSDYMRVAFAAEFRDDHAHLSGIHSICCLPLVAAISASCYPSPLCLHLQTARPHMAPQAGRQSPPSLRVFPFPTAYRNSMSNALNIHEICAFALPAATAASFNPSPKGTANPNELQNSVCWLQCELTDRKSMKMEMRIMKSNTQGWKDWGEMQWMHHTWMPPANGGLLGCVCGCIRYALYFISILYCRVCHAHSKAAICAHRIRNRPEQE